METLLTWLAITFAGLLVSSRTMVRLPVLGPTPVLGVIAVALLLAAAAALLWVVRAILRDGLRLRPAAS
jgi:hypothetical protein